MATESILFVCPAFFGYEVAIADALRENGYDVDYIDERPSNSSVYKAIFRIRKDLISKRINRYYEEILEKLKLKKYNWLFVIKGEVVPDWFITKFKELNPTAKLIYYTYDSFNNNNKHSVYILKHFDKCFSFDPEDVKKDPKLVLKHLFYTKEYLGGLDRTNRKYDLAFVGTLHSNRYSAMKKIASNFVSTRIFYYMPAKWYFYFSKLTDKEYRAIKASEISFSKISRDEVAEIFKSSKSVLDIQRFGQSGLTMRTFEVLASGCLLITTNPNIKDADFYNSDKVVVINDINDDKNIATIKQLIANEETFSKPVSPDFDKYYVNNWVKEFFN